MSLSKGCSHCDHTYQDGEFVYIVYENLSTASVHVFLGAFYDNSIVIANTIVEGEEFSLCCGCWHDEHGVNQVEADNLFLDIHWANMRVQQFEKYGTMNSQSQSQIQNDLSDIDEPNRKRCRCF